MPNQKLDSLIRRTGRPSVPAEGVRPSGLLPRLAGLVPVALIAGFLILLAVLFGDRLLPARALPVAAVVTVRETAAATAMVPAHDPHTAPMLFQASGWIEPDPLPIKATALHSGVVSEVKVLEGETVAKGQILATLIDDDAQLNLRSAEARLASLKALEAAHHGQIAISKAKIVTLGKQVLAAEAKRKEIEDVTRRFDELQAGSVSEKDIVQARLQLSTQIAEIAALSATEAELNGEVLRHTEMAKDFSARIAEAEAEAGLRRLDLERTRILSPVDGVVLRLLSVPGQKRMLEMDDPDSATIAILYQPDQLQARIDVPLEEAASLAVGQAVRIRSSFLPDRVFHGTVTRIVGEADLQRNTLQAKVRISDPDPRLRPEMLCRAEFLAAASADPAAEGAATENSPGPGRVAVFVPLTALTKISGDAAEVWTLDSEERRLEPRAISLGPRRQGDHREVLEGLKPGDRVVLDPPGDLKPGQRAAARD